jgi:hypothetical protein
MVGKSDQLLPADGGQVRIARHKATDALVGVLDRAFLPR